ncbi:MAG: DNA translocase FtsK [Spirochaetota bacterium]
MKMIQDSRYREIAGGGLIAAAFALALALGAYSTADIDHLSAGQPAVNILGPAGAYTAHILRSAFGFASFLICALIALIGWHLIRHGSLESALEKIFSLVLLTLTASGLISLSFSAPFPQNGGGYTGQFISRLLDSVFGITGAYLLMSSVTIGCLILLGVVSLSAVASTSIRKGESMTVMMKKWIDRVSVRSGERMPWITKETVFIYDETVEKASSPEKTQELMPELKLIDIPASVLAQQNLPSDIFVPGVSIADHINYLPSSAPAPSYEEDMDYLEYESRSTGEIYREEGQSFLFDKQPDHVIAPEGIAVNRIRSIEKESPADNAIPVDYHPKAAVDTEAVYTEEIISELSTDDEDEEEPLCGDTVSAEEQALPPVRTEKPRPVLRPQPAAEEPSAEEEAVPAPKVFEDIPINEEYIIPSSYLQVSPRHDRSSWETEIRKNSELLVKTLFDFSIEARVSAVNRGPVVTLYEMQLAPGVKVTRVVSLSDDIAMALAASRVRVVAPIPGKSAIGIEVPNGKREMVTLGDIINTPEYLAADMMLKVIMGKDILGKPVMLDLKKQPHLLIAGATGAGKSVCVNGVIASLVCKYDPNHLRFIMIDPKMVELQLYNGLPHLLTPVITEPDETPKALKWAIFEMERRYRLLSEQCVRDIDRYNQKIAAMRHPEEFEHLPYIVIIIDEFADLMMVAPKEMENYVTRIAQKARAVGIHVVLATQRPSVDIITGIIKANFPARVAFQVAQKIDSRTIIDQNGAEKLLGKGDMLYQSPTSSFPVRIQGAYISEEEIMQIVQKACSFGHPRYIDFDEFLKESAAIDDDAADPENDEMFVEALKIIEETKKASASYLQRRLSIGYNRAARIIERMEDLGYVGPQQGSKPREVFV